MAFKMRCPKCFGLDYSIERDNRTFGAVAQAFELVFHCRCGKQLFGDQLLKEYELQKKDYEVRGPEADGGGVLDSRSRRQDEEIRERLEQRNKRQGGGATADRDGAAGDDSEEDDPKAEDDDRPTEDKRWRQRMAALTADTGDDDDDDDEDETPSPARSRAARSVAPKSTRTEPARTVVTESAPEAKPAARTEAKEAPAKAKAPPKEPPAPKEPKVKAPPRPKAEKAAKAAPVAPPVRAEVEPEAEHDHDHDHEHDDEEDEEEDLDGEERDESDDEDVGDGTICAWPGCTNPRRPNSKYCSRACSNKNARSRHKGRVKKPGKKGNQAAA